MFDIGASELLLVVIVAIVAIGPKDLPLALRTAGRWIGKIRRVSGHFRSGIESMIREAELEDMERKWAAQNAAIMAADAATQTAEAAQQADRDSDGDQSATGKSATGKSATGKSDPESPRLPLGEAGPP